MEYPDFVSKKMSRSAVKIFKETFLCFTKLPVPKNFVDERGGVYHDFASKLFCLTAPNHFVEQPFRISQTFWYRKFSLIREGGGEGGSIPVFRQSFVFHEDKKFRRGTV